MEPICQNVFEKFSFLIKIPKNQVTQVENWVLMPHVPKLYIFFKWVILLNRWYNVTWFIWKSSMRTKETNSYKYKKENTYCSKINLTIKTVINIVWEQPELISENYFSSKTKKSLQSQWWTTNGWSMIKKAD